MTTAYNNFKETTVRGAFKNEDYPDASVLASATFDRDVTIKGTLILGDFTAGTGGDIKVKVSGVEYTITPSDLISGGGGGGGGTGFPAFIDQLTDFYDQIG